MSSRQFRSDDSAGWPFKYGNGSDGALSITGDTTDSTPNTTFSATLGSTSATVGSGTGFAANNLILIHQTRNGGTGVGNWELNQISSVGGGTNWTLVFPTIYAYDTTAQVYLLKQYSSVSISGGVTLTAQAWNGTQGGILAWLCNGTTTISGTISLSGKGFRGGLGAVGDAVQTYCGEGTTGASALQNTNQGNGGGGSNVGSGGAAGGGNATQGLKSGTSVSTVGAIVGNAGLTLADLGGGGGGASDGTGAQNGTNGGAFLAIFSKNLITSGSVLNKGINAPYVNDRYAGAGAGGSNLFKAETATLGNNLINSLGGVNQGASDGGQGYNHLDYGVSYSGITLPALDARKDNTLQTGSIISII